jgi:hypothetical protein
MGIVLTVHRIVAAKKIADVFDLLSGVRLRPEFIDTAPQSAQNPVQTRRIQGCCKVT